ncbi:cytosine deaminase [Nadsonia fulvescens var. elongata DSM 6958]|uniref:Cytosine deaminase n=1 Tax=Nadsonia fulvescens var. elongata DSM 6958 TaxID=857566 RepID=A0A1E3PDN9_9ASCO|nr:cytosine deaminase [Nadsonia fulvescens var. elongata DSM 6958]
MDALENAGRLDGAVYKDATMYTTLSPCNMCSGACLLYGIKRIVLGENLTFMGDEDYLRSTGAQVINANSAECKQLMDDFIRDKPHLWNEDIGVPNEDGQQTEV